MLASDIMRPRQRLVTVLPDASLEDVIYRFDNSVSLSRLIYVVDEEDRLLGVVGAADILSLLLPLSGPESAGSPPDRDAFQQELNARIRKHRDLPASRFMHNDFPSVRPDEPFARAAELMLSRGFTAMPVLDPDGTLAGEITRRLILRFTAHAVLHAPPS